MESGLFSRFAGQIRDLPESRRLTRRELCCDAFLLERDGDVETYYAPFDDVNRSAIVVVVGITPGWQQMEIAFREARTALREDCFRSTALRRAKFAAAFAGAMRDRLTVWLDRLGLQRHLGLTSSAELFCPSLGLLHPTSVLRYPVFVRGANYSGQSPKLTTSEGLRRSVEARFLPELARLDRPLLIPLGRRVSEVVAHYEATGAISGCTSCHGFPHPSGLNVSGPARFAEEAARLRQVVNAWAAGSRQQSRRHSRREAIE